MALNLRLWYLKLMAEFAIARTQLKSSVLLHKSDLFTHIITFWNSNSLLLRKLACHCNFVTCNELLSNTVKYQCYTAKHHQTEGATVRHDEVGNLTVCFHAYVQFWWIACLFLIIKLIPNQHQPVSKTITDDAGINVVEEVVADCSPNTRVPDFQSSFVWWRTSHQPDICTSASSEASIQRVRKQFSPLL